jgi:hypothetical protein
VGWLQPEPELDAVERIIWKHQGQMTIRVGIAGTLYVTQTRIIFVPNRLNISRDLNARDWLRTEVASVDIAASDHTPYTGGMHRRLAIHLRDGQTALFSFKLRELDRIATELRELLSVST